MPLYPLPFKQRLLFFFNVAAMTLWLCCFMRFLILLPLVGRRFLPGGIADFFHAVAVTPVIGTLLLLSLGLTKWKSQIWPLLNGIKMVCICYAVIFPHPKIAKHTSYSLLITAWCLQYIIHYSYHGFRVKTRTSPFFLFWLQYNNFYIVYPLSVVAEMIQVFLSLSFVEEDSIHELALKAMFVGYIPVAYFAWGHLKSRRDIKFTEVMKKKQLRPSAELSATKIDFKLLNNPSDKQEIKVSFKDKHTMAADPSAMSVADLGDYFDSHSRKLAIKDSIQE
ncbi:hypothetical protein KGF57_005365 [Candida theae]|uniref:Very-long-chain (3R)-3-hydroxyacyl-CoA dehydratase n=1 Tax=Candida theae TaxID=1198502 RepID=A0AAD5B9F9_9ASCO|nr:uncharacterized protein KGF57_005365 [Candida theae]KAI5948620.1 hypothetical protein KGF57_005365 [Candida theae]